MHQHGYNRSSLVDVPPQFEIGLPLYRSLAYNPLPVLSYLNLLVITQHAPLTPSFLCDSDRMVRGASGLLVRVGARAPMS